MVSRALSSTVLLSLLALACGAAEGDPERAPTGAEVDRPGGEGIATGPGEDACPAGAEIATSGLSFDGKTSGISMGVAPKLGLGKFTLEAWVRRDGSGEATGTGVGGISFVPIVGKGRGESDETVANCNYAFGFVGGRLAADFEDQTNGKNHPVVGKTEIALGEWHHVAATYDGAVWRLYLDGRLDGQRVVDAAPRADSIQHFGIGTAYDSKGAPAGHLHGAVAEVRVWSFARSEAEIRDAMRKRVDKGAGLAGRWSLDGAGGLTDSVGGTNGTAAGATAQVSPGPALDMGAAPRVSDPTPKSGTVLAANAQSTELSVTVDDPDDQTRVTEFFVREIGEAEDFSVVVLPDTQMYTLKALGFEEYFYDQTKWVMNNRKAYNIKAVIHNGDIVNNGDKIDYQWTVADRAMKTLEVKSPELPDGMPWGIGLGNHDRDDGAGSVGDGTTVRYNQVFGLGRFQGRAYYGGHRLANNDDNWITFNAGGLDFVILSLRYLDSAPTKAVTDWARRVFETHPYAFGVLNSHSLLGGSGGFSAGGKGVYEALKDVPNLHLMTCGHVSAEARRDDTFQGHRIDSMLADFQAYKRDTPEFRGGEGFMRIWEFSPSSDELTVRTYSPTSKKWKTGADSEFTLKVDLSGVGGAFRKVARVSGDQATVSASLTGLAPATKYEWYAAVSDCAHTVQSARHRFSTKAQ